VQLRPPGSTVIGRGDRVVVIAADDDEIHLRSGPAPTIDATAVVTCDPTPTPPEATLVLGWNWRVLQIAGELDGYVTQGSRLTIVSDDPAAAESIDTLRSSLVNQELTFLPKSPTDRRTLDALGVADYQHILAVSPTDRFDPQRADARTLVTLLHLRDIASTAGHPFSITSEMADVRNRSLAEVTRADDFIVSDRLISLLLTQVSENKDLNPVFTDLFDSEGSEIYLRPASDYVQPGATVTYATVVEAARRYGEVALGYRIRAEWNDATSAYGVHLNPRLDTSVTLDAADKVVVLAAA
jgi:hypothetical protein